MNYKNGGDQQRERRQWREDQQRERQQWQDWLRKWAIITFAIIFAFGIIVSVVIFFVLFFKH